MSAEQDELVRRLLEALGAAAYEKVLPQIGSSTLQAALQVLIEEQELQVRLFIPHYWAVYYHDGRSGFGPKDATFLVFFPDPKDDPRLIAGRSPERANQLRRLTKAEFYRGLSENTRRRKAGLPPFMLVIQNEDGSPGTVGPAPAHPFFTEGMAGFALEADDITYPIVDEFVQRIVDDLQVRSDTAEVEISFDP